MPSATTVLALVQVIRLSVVVCLHVLVYCYTEQDARLHNNLKCRIIVIVIVNSWFLERPQKRSRRNQLIHRRLTKTKSIGSGQDPESQAGRQSDGYGEWCLELRRGGRYCNVRAISYKRQINFFIVAAPRVISFVATSFTSLFAMVLRTVNAAAHPCFAGFLGVWCRAFRARIVYMLPRAMVPRARPNGLVVSAWCRSLHGAAHLYAAAHQCYRALFILAFVAAHPWCRAPVLPRGHARRYVWLCRRASHMAPRSSTCGRAPMVPRAAERFVVLACV